MTTKAKCESIVEIMNTRMVCGHVRYRVWIVSSTFKNKKLNRSGYTILECSTCDDTFSEIECDKCNGTGILFLYHAKPKKARQP